MNFNNFTIKSQEAIQKAVDIAKGNGQQSIEPVHLLKGVMTEGDSLIKFLFQKVGANLSLLSDRVDNAIASLPKVSGGEPYLSRESNDVLQKALDVSKKLGDQYVTLEALLTAIYQVSSPASTILKDMVSTKKSLRPPSMSSVKAKRPPTRVQRTRTMHSASTPSTSTNAPARANSTP